MGDVDTIQYVHISSLKSEKSESCGCKGCQRTANEPIP